MAVCASGAMPMPVSCHADLYPIAGPAHGTLDVPLLREFDRVTDKVEQDLGEAVGVGRDRGELWFDRND